MSGPALATQRATGSGASPMTPRLSQLTRLERDAYLNGHGGWDMTYGYPDALTPEWIRERQARPPARFWRTRPAEFIAVIEGYFEALFGSKVFLTPTCSMAFAIAAAAVLRPGDEAVVIDRSYDSWPLFLEMVGAKVVYARRTPAGLPDVASIADACTSKTRAVVLVSPDNPLGVICTGDVLARIAALCKDRDLTLLIDHCLAEVNPGRRLIPLLPRLRAAEGLSWIAIGDTGKVLLGLSEPKFSALACSGRWREPIAAAASPFFLSYSQYNLAVGAGILADRRFTAYREWLSGEVAANYAYLARAVRAPLTVSPLGAGCFAVVDAKGTGLDGAGLAERLKRVRVLVSPVSLFPAGEDDADARVRVALSRPAAWVGSLVTALNAAVP
jgi:aspartate/methionine/tyrosine aminotransferase